MRLFQKLVLVLIAALALAAQGGSAEAKKKWNTVGQCYPAIDGIGTGKGMFGRGTARARIEARSNWEAAAASKYGLASARFYMARDVTWDCKKLAILTAKCVVTAKPCEARLRG